MLTFWLVGFFSLMVAALATIRFLIKLRSRITLTTELEKARKKVMVLSGISMVMASLLFVSFLPASPKPVYKSPSLNTPNQKSELKMLATLKVQQSGIL